MEEELMSLSLVSKPEYRVVENGLVPIYADDTNDNLVDARELFEFLGSKQDFSNWIKGRLGSYGFVEGQDFSINLSESGGGRPRTDYYLKLDVAKEIAMVENNDRGREVRRYFIEVERRAKTTVSSMSQLQVLQHVVNGMVEQERKIHLVEQGQHRLAGKVEQLENKVEKRMTDDFASQLVTPTQVGKMFEPSISGKEVNRRLQNAGLQWKVGGEWVATAKGKAYGSSEPLQLPNGKMVYQLNWRRSVKDLITDGGAS
jgi:phage anti-repressor protein